MVNINFVVNIRVHVINMDKCDDEKLHRLEFSSPSLKLIVLCLPYDVDCILSHLYIYNICIYHMSMFIMPVVSGNGE